jgi:ABC-type uncharacterized transport system permease subunit
MFSCLSSKLNGIRKNPSKRLKRYADGIDVGTTNVVVLSLASGMPVTGGSSYADGQSYAEATVGVGLPMTMTKLR